MSSDRAIVIALGALGAVAIVLGVLMQRLAGTLAFAKAKKPAPSGIKAPILALELPQSSADVAAVVGDRGSVDRETMRKIQYIDFLFIADYWLLFSGFAWLMIHNSPEFLLAAVVAFLCSTAGAFFDVREDQSILKLLDAPIPVPKSLVEATRNASRTKWGLLFAALILLSILFFDLDGSIVNALGAVYLAAGVIGVFGIWKPRAIEIANPLLSLGLLASTILLLASPDRFLR
jgi:hypothetical protein